MNPLFKGIGANDPKDLVLFMLNTIHKETNEKSQMNIYMTMHNPQINLTLWLSIMILSIIVLIKIIQ